MYPRLFALIGVSVVVLAVAANNADAVLITYEVEYDPDTETTVIFNYASSLSSLLVFPTTGPHRYEQWWIAPGGEMVVQGNTVISGGTSTKWRYWHKNLLSSDKDWHITAPAPEDWNGQEGSNNRWGSKFKVQECVWLKRGGCYDIRWKEGTSWSVDDPVEGLPDDEGLAILYLTASDILYPFPSFYWPDQAVFELLSGKLRITTDTDAFVSAFTPNLATGCNNIPEPSTLIIWGLGIVITVGAPWAARKRKMTYRVR